MSLCASKPQIQPKEAIAPPPPMVQNPFEGEFGFAGDLEIIFELELSATSDCPCEQFGLLACPFCNTEQMSKDVIKVRSPILRSLNKLWNDSIMI